MRLIDADALIKVIQQNDYMLTAKHNSMAPGMFTSGIRQAVDDAPTADVVPVVRGEWVVTDAYPHRVYCSLCYKTNVPNEEWLYEKNDYPKYCMWCGAKMENEK